MPATQTRYPSNLDSHSGADPFGFGQVDNYVSTALNGAISAVATTITVDSTSAFPARGAFVIETEAISYTGKTATTFTGCVRGFDGSTAAPHSDDIDVRLVPLAANHNDVAGAVAALEAKVGTGASTSSAGTVMRGTGSGASAWGKIQTDDIDAINQIDLSQQGAAPAAPGAGKTRTYARTDGNLYTRSGASGAESRVEGSFARLFMFG
jgi:hypothetical protein